MGNEWQNEKWVTNLLLLLGFVCLKKITKKLLAKKKLKLFFKIITDVPTNQPTNQLTNQLLEMSFATTETVKTKTVKEFLLNYEKSFTNETVKELIRNLLEHYANKEKTTTHEPRIFVQLDASRRGVLANLSDVDAMIVIHLYNALSSKNYYIFDKRSIEEVIYENAEDAEDAEDCDDYDKIVEKHFMALQQDIKEGKINNWIKYLEMIPLKVDDEDYLECYGTQIDDLCAYKVENFNKKFYSLNEIIEKYYPTL